MAKGLPKEGKEYTVAKIIYGQGYAHFGRHRRSNSSGKLVTFELKVSRDSLPSLAEDEVYLAT